MQDQQETTEGPIRAWQHSRKGRLVGTVIWVKDEWTMIRCTEPNRQADVGETLTFRTSLAKEVQV